MLSVNAVGEPLAGKPHEWFDGRVLETEQPTRPCGPRAGALRNATTMAWTGTTSMDHCHRASARPYTARTVR
jgi:hypothetical protein